MYARPGDRPLGHVGRLGRLTRDLLVRGVPARVLRIARRRRLSRRGSGDLRCRRRAGGGLLGVGAGKRRRDDGANHENGDEGSWGHGSAQHLCKRRDSASRVPREPAHGCCRAGRFEQLAREVTKIGRRRAAAGQLSSDRLFVDGLYWRRGSRYGRAHAWITVWVVVVVVVDHRRRAARVAAGEPRPECSGAGRAGGEHPGQQCRAATAAMPGPPMPPGPPGPPGPPPAYGYGPIVTVRSDHPRARLQVQGPLKWQDVCVAPCNVPVNPQGLYRIGGGTIRPSDGFNMPRPAGQVVVEAQTGSTVKHWVGFGLIIGGVGRRRERDAALRERARRDRQRRQHHDSATRAHAVGIVVHRRRPHPARGRHPAVDEQHVGRRSLTGPASRRLGRPFRPARLLASASSAASAGTGCRRARGRAPSTLVIPARSGSPSVSWKNSRSHQLRVIEAVDDPRRRCGSRSPSASRAPPAARDRPRVPARSAGDSLPASDSPRQHRQRHARREHRIEKAGRVADAAPARGRTACRLR